MCITGAVFGVLKSVPDNDRVEIFFEQQREYANRAEMLMGVLAQGGNRTTSREMDEASWLDGGSCPRDRLS